MLPMIIDIFLLILLVVTLFYGLRLSRQFSEIKADQIRLGELVKQLDTASAKAEAAVKNMKKNAVEASDSLQAQNRAAQGLSEELEIMIEAGNSLAERLQNIATSSRKAVQNDSKTPSKSGKGRTRAEQELHDAISKKSGKK